MRTGRPPVHGASRKSNVQPTYNSWRKMIDRCYNPNHVQYRNYGGRGITVCAEWRGDYAAFHRDMGDRPPGKSLDRVDNDLGYSKENCKWSTQKEQSRNTQRTRRYPFKGALLRIDELVEVTGLSEQTLRGRLKQVRLGIWTLEEALTLPPRGKCAKSKESGNRRPIASSYFIEGSIRSAATKAGIRYGTILYRVRRCGMTIQEAIDCKPYSSTKTARKKNKEGKQNDERRSHELTLRVLQPPYG